MTTPAELWYNPACSKCRTVLSSLEEAGAEVVVRRYLDQPPSVAELAAVLDRLGLEPWDITRLGDPLASSLGLASLPRVRAAWLPVLAAHPSLIQRPIVLAPDGSAWVARDADSVSAAVAALSPSALSPSAGADLQ